MRRGVKKLCIAALAAALAALSGCAESIYDNYRDVGSLQIVQAIGIDGEPGALTLSAATGADASGRPPLRLKCEAASLDEAMLRLESMAGAGELFFAGTGAVVLGPTAAESAAQWLDALTRSKVFRLDTGVYVLKNAAASELLCGKDAPEDVFASLEALSRRLRRTGPAPAASGDALARGLIESGAALAAAVELSDGEPQPAGFAVLAADGLAGYLEGDAASGAGLLLSGAQGEYLTLDGVTLELMSAGASAEPEGGTVCVEVCVKAGVVEAPAGSSLGSDAAWEELEGRLASVIRGRVEAALGASARMDADFLALGRRFEALFPGEAADFSPARALYEVTAAAEIVNAREYADSPYGGKP